MPELHGRNNRNYVKATKRLRRQDQTCWICNQPIDLTLDWRDPMSWTADHMTPLSTGGNLLGPMRPAHRGCNSRRGNGQSRPNKKRPEVKHPGMT